MSLKLPKTLYAIVDKDGEERYYIANEAVEPLVDEEGVTRVGTYKLQSVHSYKQVVEIVKEG